MSDRSFRLAASDIDQAFERNEFCVVFQPKVELATKRMTGAEVFVRWQHPQYGLLPPGLFLDFVEANGRMADMTGFVFHSALDGAREWKAKGRDWSVSINVAPGTVTSPGFAEGLERLLADYGVDPKMVIIEVPERAVAQEPDTLCEALLQVRAIGVHVALDGGGIVPVDLSRFVPMPFTSVKVGGPASIRLAQRLGSKGKGAIAARLRFAQQHSLEAVAVGAEEEATLTGLAEVGFTAAQGIWIQRPLTLDELLAWNGSWARGNLATGVVTQARAPAAPAKPVERSVAVPVEKPAVVWVTKREVTKTPEGPKATRKLVLTPKAFQPKPERREAPVLTAMDTSDLEDIVEDEEASAPAVKQQGFGLQGDPCPTMKSLVQRRDATSAPKGLRKATL
jgi:EAL domain-containing protein (putative c-di-GMP-specific phosphodiesterase class I)